MRKFFFALLLLSALLACSDEPSSVQRPVEASQPGLLIASEGKFGEGNGSLSFYNPETQAVEHELFLRANGHYLGDTPHSITLYDNLCWIVVNNSGVIYAIDPSTYEVKRIINEGLTSPRYICFASPEKAYVSELWSSRILIVNPKSGLVEGSIATTMNDMEGSTEQMILLGDYLYVTCWSYQKQLIKIDTRTDRVVASIEVGVQPKELALDKNGKLWCMTDGGGWAENPVGYESPKLVRIDPETMTIEALFTMSLGDFPAELRMDGAAENLFWINGSNLWRMNIAAETLPTEPLLTSDAAYLYGLMIDHTTGDIYLSDAADFSQNGTVVRYSASCQELDRFSAGIAARAFCWKR